MSPLRNPRILPRSALLAALICAAPATHAVAAGSGQAAAAPVVTQTLVPGDFRIEQDAVGHVTPLNLVRIRPQVGGQLTSVDVREGGQVTAGTVLARIDPRSLQATLDQDEATTAEDRAALGSAQATLARSMPLLAKGLVSAQDIQVQKAQAAGLRAKVQADLAGAERDRVHLGYTTITSPIDGVAGLLNVTVGNTVSPQDAMGLVVVTQIEPIGVLFAVPANTLPTLQQALRDAGPDGVAVEAWSSSGQQKLGDGKLAVIDNQVDPASGTVMLKALFPNQDHRLWPGAFVNARIILATRHDALSVPLDAIQQAASGSFVWTISPDDKAQQKPVHVAQSNHGLALVDQGLSQGEKIVVNGQYGLTDGMATQGIAANSGMSPRGKPVQNAGTAQLGVSP